MRGAGAVTDILRIDPERWALLGLVADLGLPDAWIAAGFVRNAVWDALHGRPPQRITGDIDVIWFDPACTSAERDREIEARLLASAPHADWSVKNQARMHVRNGDAPYSSATDAMRYWPETATAVAARRSADGTCLIAAPFGLDDLLGGRIRPTPHFSGTRRATFQARVDGKQWLERWSRLTLEPAAEKRHMIG